MCSGHVAMLALSGSSLSSLCGIATPTFPPVTKWS